MATACCLGSSARRPAAARAMRAIKVNADVSRTTFVAPFWCVVASRSDLLADAQESDVEDEVGVGRDAGADVARRTVAEIGGDEKRAFFADVHACDALIEAGDDLLRIRQD